MDRRAFLAALGVLGAGCAGGGGGGSGSSSDGDDSTTTATSTAAATATSTATATATPTSVPKATPNDNGRFETGELVYYLEQDGDFQVEVEYAAVVEDTLMLHYESGAGDSTKLGDTEANERVFVADAYTQWEADNDGAVPLYATVVDSFGDARYTWRCETEWARAVQAEEASLRDLRAKITETVSDP